jgi:IS30 family transposase
VTSGRSFPLAVRQELFDLICGGVPLRTAAEDLGVSSTAATNWWQQAGGMTLTWGLVQPGWLCLVIGNGPAAGAVG